MNKYIIWFNPFYDVRVTWANSIEDARDEATRLALETGVDPSDLSDCAWAEEYTLDRAEEYDLLPYEYAE